MRFTKKIAQNGDFRIKYYFLILPYSRVNKRIKTTLWLSNVYIVEIFNGNKWQPVYSISTWRNSIFPNIEISICSDKITESNYKGVIDCLNSNSAKDQDLAWGLIKE